jgi:hypothetical protein
MRQPVKDKCLNCGGPLERGDQGHPHGVDSDEAECLRCLQQYAVYNDGTIEFAYTLPGLPLPPSEWREVITTGVT